jgi:hypothetical protein
LIATAAAAAAAADDDDDHTAFCTVFNERKEVNLTFFCTFLFSYLKIVFWPSLIASAVYRIQSV